MRWDRCTRTPIVGQWKEWTFVLRNRREPKDDGEEYCECRKGWRVGQWMVQCSTCEEWYHGVCVKIKPNERFLYDEGILNFVCEPCEKPDRRDDGSESESD